MKYRYYNPYKSNKFIFIVSIKIMILSIFIMFSSCAAKNNIIKNELETFKSAPINLAIEAETIFYNDDLTSFDFNTCKLKVVIYVDSTLCNSCVISKLNSWNPLIKSFSTQNDKVNFYFIFHPPKDEDIHLALKNSLLDYPILLDSLGEFERLNPHLPKNKAMHTFLLDEENNVIVVGNPLQSNEIRKMFYEEVEKRLGND